MLATKPRGWTGTRTPSALKRVRTTKRRTEVNGPRRSEAKTLVVKALRTATAGVVEDTQEALLAALSALDRAAKSGAIHANQAARRKSRLTVRINAAIGGDQVQTSTKVTKSTGALAAAKAAKARIAAGKAAKAKGAQTAAGKARAALSKTARAEAAAAAGRPRPPAERLPAPPKARHREGHRPRRPQGRPQGQGAREGTAAKAAADQAGREGQGAPAKKADDRRRQAPGRDVHVRRPGLAGAFRFADGRSYAPASDARRTARRRAPAPESVVRRTRQAEDDAPIAAATTVTAISVPAVGELLAPVERRERGHVGDPRTGEAGGVLGQVAGIDAARTAGAAQRAAEAAGRGSRCRR